MKKYRKNRWVRLKPKSPRLDDYPPRLRGPYIRCQRLRTLGGKFGPASKCRSLSAEEIQKYAEEHGLSVTLSHDTTEI